MFVALADRVFPYAGVPLILTVTTGVPLLIVVPPSVPDEPPPVLP